MEQILVNVENTSILPSLERVLSSLEGVSISKVPQKLVPIQIQPAAKKKKTELERAIEDVKKGELHTFKSVDALMDYLNA